ALCPEGNEANGAAIFTLMGKDYMLYPYGDFRSTLGFRFMLAESNDSQPTESQGKAKSPGDNSQFSILNSQFSNYHATWVFPQLGLGKVNSSTWDAPCCVTDGDQPNQKNLYIYVPGNGIAAYTLTAGIRGDVNGDGKVDIADVNAVINAMLGKGGLTPSPSPGGEGSPADINGDGKVDIADVNAVINIMLGK
ncbi:MAG: dockerin type I repeat-containing protein, partial [Muribaculaceae bacterium]|nr:dockerin type I repeat-containing protein [Muribaculaceae bacterium]